MEPRLDRVRQRAFRPRRPQNRCVWCTCQHVSNMPKMIQIRDVPDDLHIVLKTRAAKESMTLSDYLKRELQAVAEKPTMREWLEWTSRSKPIRTHKSGAELIRELRDGRSR